MPDAIKKVLIHWHQNASLPFFTIPHYIYFLGIIRSFLKGREATYPTTILLSFFAPRREWCIDRPRRPLRLNKTKNYFENGRKSKLSSNKMRGKWWVIHDGGANIQCAIGYDTF